MKTLFNNKSLMTLIFASAASISVASAGSDLKESEKALYKDPVTGEVKEAKKMLSEMTDAEKATLSNEEYKALKDLEMKKESKKVEMKSPE